MVKTASRKQCRRIVRHSNKSESRDIQSGLNRSHVAFPAPDLPEWFQSRYPMSTPRVEGAVDAFGRRWC